MLARMIHGQDNERGRKAAAASVPLCVGAFIQGPQVRLKP